MLELKQIWLTRMICIRNLLEDLMEKQKESKEKEDFTVLSRLPERNYYSTENTWKRSAG